MTLEEWLSSIGLSHYKDVFERNNLDVPMLSRLSDDDLKEIGVASLGHRRMILDKLREDATQAANGVEMELPGGLWFHQNGGFAYIPDKGQDMPFVVLSHFIKTVAAYQPKIASWLLNHHYPTAAAAKDDVLMKFWKDLAVVMVTHGDWVMAWKGFIYTNKLDIGKVSRCLKAVRAGYQDLKWPDEAAVTVIDVHDSSRKIDLRWDSLLAAADSAPEESDDGIEKEPGTDDSPFT